MKALLTSTLLLAPLLVSCQLFPDYNRPLPAGASALILLDKEEARPAIASQFEAREELLPVLERSLSWTRRPAARTYFPVAAIEYRRAWLSLERLHELLLESTDAEGFENAVNAEFDVYKSAGWDGRGGGVLFTGYCTPVFKGSLSASARFRYPLYSLPSDLVKGKDGTTLGWQTVVGLKPYPSRRSIDAGFLKNKGLELVWLEDPVDAFIAHVNGSAFVELEDGEQLRLGYAGKNGRTYTSLGKELVADGKVARDTMNLAAIRAWGRSSPPDEVREYLERNESYVFFQPINGNPHGSLDVEVSARRSLATDKELFPRAALVFADTALADGTPFQQFLFDQDTGGAIRTAGRADIYMGVGPEAEELAGHTQAKGQLYYYFLKPKREAELASSGRYNLAEPDSKFNSATTQP